jgi:predicted ATP-dependent Lon-type protease
MGKTSLLYHLAERLQLAMDNGAKRVLLPADRKSVV